jgi:hypothetical protein
MALGTRAFAEPIVAPPAGWHGGPNAELAAQSTARPHFGTSGAAVLAERYDAPTPGIVLFAVRTSAPTTNAAAAAAAELAALRDHGPNVQVVETREHVDDASKSVEAIVDWRDVSTKTTDATRTILVATRDRITSITGECLAASDTAPALIDACKAALQTLRVDVDAAARIAFAPGPSVPTATDNAPGMSTVPTNAPSGRPTIPPIAVPQDDPPWDKRPLIVGAGLVVLAGVFWWNRKRRRRFAAESGTAPPGPSGSRGGSDE